MSQLDETNALYKLSWLYQAKTKVKQSNTKAIKPDYVISTPTYDELVQDQLTALSDMAFLACRQVDVLV
ncbi:MAG: hypothetical protein K0U24_01180 [Gammaproteobacteria bacterium]|nr:hypothetical protein [Gammaproteobacteria bacterium]